MSKPAAGGAARNDRPTPTAPPVDPVLVGNGILTAGLLLAAVLYLGFPTQSIYGGRDEGVYATHAVYIAKHGRLDVPYPWPDDAAAIFAHTAVKFPGFYQTQPTMTVQFGHLFPVWLAQAYATGAQEGLFRLNAVLALLSLAAFYGVCRTLLPQPYAVAATLFFALNPSQMWMARITLSEILTQLLTWSGLVLLLRALRDSDQWAARWAGAFLGASAFVRFDSLLLVPMLFLAHAAWRVFQDEDGRAASVWPAIYQTALPVFALALAYFAYFCTPYLMERYYWQKLVAACAVAAALLLVSMTGLSKQLRPWVTGKPFLIGAGVALFALAAYAYWIRPIPSGPPHTRYLWPGYYWDYSKGNHSIESLVNLARYLSPPVIWLGIGGWFVMLWDVARGRHHAERLALLIAVAGLSAVYLYDHGNTPDHFWVIRRYIAVIIPGFVLCAALGAYWVLAQLPRAAWLATSAVVIVFLTAFTVRADALIATFAEDKGYFEQLQHVAEQLPRDQVVLARGFTSWVTPLYVAFDRRVIPLNLDVSAKGRGALNAWVAHEAAQRRPAYLLMEGGTDLRGFDVRQLNQVRISRVYTEPTTQPLPKKIVTRERILRLYELRPPAR